MSSNQNFTVIIPLRADSKGLVNKNIMELDGKPLYLHAVDLALEANASRIIVTTNINKVLQSSLDDRIEVIRRPEKLCSDSVTMCPVLLHAIEKLVVQGVVVLLQPTSPLRSLKDIRASLDLFDSSGSDLVLTLSKADSSVLKWGELNDNGLFLPLSGGKHVFSNRQSLPVVYKPNGAIYVFRAEWLSQNKTLNKAKTISGIKMPKRRSYDIDTLEDFVLCQQILKSVRK